MVGLVLSSFGFVGLFLYCWMICGVCINRFGIYVEVFKICMSCLVIVGLFCSVVRY